MTINQDCLNTSLILNILGLIVFKLDVESKLSFIFFDLNY